MVKIKYFIPIYFIEKYCKYNIVKLITIGNDTIISTLKVLALKIFIIVQNTKIPKLLANSKCLF